MCALMLMHRVFSQTVPAVASLRCTILFCAQCNNRGAEGTIVTKGPGLLAILLFSCFAVIPDYPY